MRKLVADTTDDAVLELLCIGEVEDIARPLPDSLTTVNYSSDRPYGVGVYTGVMIIEERLGLSQLAWRTLDEPGYRYDFVIMPTNNIHPPWRYQVELVIREGVSWPLITCHLEEDTALIKRRLLERFKELRRIQRRRGEINPFNTLIDRLEKELDQLNPPA